MNTTSLLAFAAAYLAVLVLPGPGVTALVARVLARGTQGVPTFIAGFVAGALLWFAIAATGLAALATTFASLFLIIRYLCAAYLLYLAWKFWTSAPRTMNVTDARTAASTGFLPTVVNVDRLTTSDFAELAAIS